MHIGIGTICAILFILLLIAIFVGLAIAVKYRNTKNKYNRQRSETAQWQNNYNRIDTQFTGLTTQIAQEEALKKEVEKRRRVTQKTKNTVLERDNKVCQICGISYNFVEELCTGLGDYYTDSGSGIMPDAEHYVATPDGYNAGKGDFRRVYAF